MAFNCTLICRQLTCKIIVIIFISVCFSRRRGCCLTCNLHGPVIIATRENFHSLCHAALVSPVPFFLFTPDCSGYHQVDMNMMHDWPWRSGRHISNSTFITWPADWLVSGHTPPADVPPSIHATLPKWTCHQQQKQQQQQKHNQQIETQFQLLWWSWVELGADHKLPISSPSSPLAVLLFAN